MQNETQAVPQQMQRLVGSCICFPREDDVVMDWQPIDSAPFGQDLQLGVIEGGEVHSLVFPCRRTKDGWLNGRTSKPVPVRPTHWRPWVEIS